MRRIKSKDTSIDLMLRKEHWKRGFRYRKNATGIYGKTDIVFKGKMLIENIERNKKVNKELTEEGWVVLRFCETDIRNNLISCADIVAKYILEITRHHPAI